jgi:thiamine pyrophosphokinase
MDVKMNRALIITGGSISIPFAKEYLKNQKFDLVIAVDSGLKAVKELNIPVSFIVGDFDSVPEEVLEHYKQNSKESVFLEFNPMKDATDTQLALELAIENGAMEIILLGATGTRLDHTLANIHLLNIPLMEHRNAYIIDEHNKIYLINQDICLTKEQLHGPYISLQPFTEMVQKVTLQGFLYPLKDKDMNSYESLGISNEIIEEKAEIKLQSGILIVIEAKD